MTYEEWKHLKTDTQVWTIAAMPGSRHRVAYPFEVVVRWRLMSAREHREGIVYTATPGNNVLEAIVSRHDRKCKRLVGHPDVFFTFEEACRGYAKLAAIEARDLLSLADGLMQTIAFMELETKR